MSKQPPLGLFGRCDYCQERTNKDFLVPNEEGMLICVDCLMHSGVKNIKWYAPKHTNGANSNVPCGSYSMVIDKKPDIVNLDNKLACPNCRSFSWDDKKNKCTTCNNTKLDDSQWLHQRLWWIEYLCPFCGHLHYDTRNSTCMHCKAHLGKKAMKKQYKKALKRKDADPKNIEICTICQGTDTWPEIHWCLNCRTMYRVDHPDTTKCGFIAGRPDNNFAKFAIAPKHSIANPYQTTMVDTRLSIRVIGEAVFTRLKFMDNEENEEDTLVIIEKEQFKDMSWKEKDVKLTGFEIVAKIRYLEDQPEHFVLMEYAVPELEEKVKDLIPKALTKTNKSDKK